LTSCAARVRPPLAPAEAVIAAPAALVRVPEVTASVVLTLLLLAVIRSRVPLLVNPAATVSAALPKEPSPCTRRRSPRRWSGAPLMTVVPLGRERPLIDQAGVDRVAGQGEGFPC